MYFFYILYSESVDKFYTGHTSNLTERIKKHNSNHKGFTGNTNDWSVVYSEQYSSKSEAFVREREVKAWKSRKRIAALCSFDSEHSA